MKKKKVILLFCLVIISLPILSQNIDGYFKKVNISIDNNNLEDAKAYLDTIISYDENNIEAYSTRGYVDAMMKKFDKALSDFSYVLKIDSTNSRAYNHRGIVKKELNNIDGALKDYNKSILYDNNNASAYFNRANIKYDFLEDKEGACSDWNISYKLGYNNAYYASKGICNIETFGAVKTSNSYLVYYDYPTTSFTFDLPDNAGFNNYPLISFGNEGEFVEILIADKSQFEKEGSDVLDEYTKWEISWLVKNKFIDKTSDLTTDIIEINDLEIHYWSITSSNIPEGIANPVTIRIFADFVFNDKLVRISYPSIEKNIPNARKRILSIIHGMNIYTSRIDLPRLQESIIKGTKY